MARIIKRTERKSTAFSPYERAALGRAGSGRSLGGNVETILDEARAEAEQRLQEAYLEGLRRGAEAGRHEYLETIGESAQALRRLAEELQEARWKFLDMLEQHMLDLTRAIVSRILQREASVDREAAQRILRQIIEHLTERQHLIVRMNPVDAEALKQEAPHALDAFEGILHKEIVPDESVAPGGCVVETGTLVVDGQLDAQLERILEGLSRVKQNDADAS